METKFESLKPEYVKINNLGDMEKLPRDEFYVYVTPQQYKDYERLMNPELEYRDEPLIFWSRELKIRDYGHSKAENSI